MIALRNPAHPDALTHEDVQPGIDFKCYSTKGEFLYGGRFISKPVDGKVLLAVSGGMERYGYLSDLGIVQRVGGESIGSFWAETYCLRA